MEYLEPFPEIQGLLTVLHYYQYKGMPMILTTWQEQNQGCVFGDEIGLGKTIQAITTYRADQGEEISAFDLDITSETYMPQWELER